MSTPPAPDPPKGLQFVEPPALILSTINRQIDEALALLPADKFVTAVLDVRTTAGVNAAVAARINGEWSVVGYVAKRWGAPVEGGVSVRFSR